MATFPASNSFDTGQASGTGITTGNSGGGTGNTAFDAISGSPVYDSAQAHSGGLSFNPGTSGVCQVAWLTSATDVWARFYIYIPSTLIGGVRVFQMNGVTTSDLHRIAIGTGTSQVKININSGTNVTSATSLATNAWSRIETHCSVTGTTATIEAKIFTGSNVDGTTPDETITQSGAISDTSIIKVLLGPGSAPTNTFYLDDPTANLTGYPGPTSGSSGTATDAATTFGGSASGFITGSATDTLTVFRGAATGASGSGAATDTHTSFGGSAAGSVSAAGSATDATTTFRGAANGSVSSPGAPFTIKTPWEVYLCDRFGYPISNISRVCFAKQLTQTLNQPAAFTFWTPSNAAQVATLHTDGKPYLVEGRSIRVYRAGVLVFTGHLWQIEDDGDAETVRTAVTCLDPLQWLTRRVARKMAYDISVQVGSPAVNLCVSTFNPGWDRVYNFTIDDGATDSGSIPSADIVRGLLNATNDYDGFTGLDDGYLSALYRPDHSTPSACTNQSTPSTPNAAPQFSSSRVSDVIATLVGQNNGLDLEVVPTDSDYYSSPGYPSITTGATFQRAYLVGSAGDYSTIRGSLQTKPWKTLALLKYWAPTKGATQPNVVFGYGAYPHNVTQVSYLTDLTSLTNQSTMMGGSITRRSTNLTSVQTYGAGMDIQSLADITDPTLLQALAVEEAALGGNAKRTLQITPMGGARTPLPFDNFVLGDTVTINIGSKLRGGLVGTQRIYGFTLDIADDHTTETLTNLITSPQTA